MTISKYKRSYLIIIYFILLIFINIKVISIGFVFGNSMYPTLNDQRVVLLLKWNYNINTNDIVMIYDQQLNSNIIKRVVGVAGDHLIINNYKLIVNDQIISNYNGITSIDDIDIIIPDNSIFVVGDNFDQSIDSRELGVYNYQQVLGKVIYNILGDNNNDFKN